MVIYLFVFTVVTGYSMAWYLGKIGGEFDGVVLEDTYLPQQVPKPGYVAITMSSKWNPADSLKIGQYLEYTIETRSRSINLTYEIPDKVDIGFLVDGRAKIGYTTQENSRYMVSLEGPKVLEDRFAVSYDTGMPTRNSYSSAFWSEYLWHPAELHIQEKGNVSIGERWYYSTVEGYRGIAEVVDTEIIAGEECYLIESTLIVTKVYPKEQMCIRKGFPLLMKYGNGKDININLVKYV